MGTVGADKCLPSVCYIRHSNLEVSNLEVLHGEGLLGLRFSQSPPDSDVLPGCSHQSFDIWAKKRGPSGQWAPLGQIMEQHWIKSSPSFEELAT